MKGPDVFDFGVIRPKILKSLIINTKNLYVLTKYEQYNVLEPRSEPIVECLTIGTTYLFINFRPTSSEILLPFPLF